MNYLITYSTLDKASKVLKQGKMRVKNKLSKAHAKASLEEYFERKLIGFRQLIIYECKEVNKLIEFMKEKFNVELNLN
jgi:hypothetical protein